MNFKLYRLYKRETNIWNNVYNSKTFINKLTDIIVTDEEISISKT